MSPLETRADDSPSVQRKIAVVLVAAALLMAPGCAGLFGNGGGDAGEPAGPALDTVPAGVDSLLYVDVNGTLEDDDITSIANTVYGLDDSGPDSMEAAIQQVEANTSLDVSELQSITAFGSTQDINASEGYGGVIVNADWSINMVVNEIENESNTSMEATQFAGRQIWQPESPGENEDSYVGKLGEGQFVVGTEAAVKDTLRVQSGDTDPVSGEIRTAFENTRDGAYVRFATDIPQDEVDAGELPGNTDVFNQVTMVAGSHYVAGDQVTVNATLSFESDSAAGDAQSVIEGAIQIWRGGMVEDPTVKALISEENVTVRQSGADVTLSAANTASAISAAIESLYNTWFGVTLGDQQSASRAPLAG